MFNKFKCPGCQREELHKMCPAFGTPFYMSGKLYTEEDEKLYAAQHKAAIRKCAEGSLQKGSAK